MSQSFTDSPVDWSNFLQSPPPASDSHLHFPISDPNATSLNFDSAPPPITATSNSNDKSSSTAPRVMKPVRKRSRASRRTPTTLLTTDTSNFRAMVQQFTGGPSSALGPAIDHQAITTSLPFHGSRHSLQFHPQQGVTGLMGSSFRSSIGGGNNLY